MPMPDNADNEQTATQWLAHRVLSEAMQTHPVRHPFAQAYVTAVLADVALHN